MIPARRARALAWIVPLLFLFEAGILAARIVPLWDVSDETGHFAYAREIWSGKGLLPLGQAQIDADIMSDVLDRPSDAIPNAVAHHPPLYHVLAGAVWKAATLFTDDPQLLFRAPRVLSPIFGAVALFYVYKLVERAGFSSPAAVAVAAGLSGIPRFVWQSAGTSHDVLLAAFSASSAFFFLDFLMSRHARSAYASVTLMSLAAATKISALIVLGVLLVCLALEIPTSGGAGKWAARLLGLAAVGLVLPSLWLMRSALLYGSPFTLAEDILGGRPFMDQPLQIGFLEYLRSQPAIEEFFVTFIGHLGWVGKTSGAQAWYNVVPPFRTVYEFGLVVLAALALVWIGRAAFLGSHAHAGATEPQSLLRVLQRAAPIAARRGLIGLSTVAAFVLLAFSFTATFATTTSWLLSLGVSIVFALGAAPLLLALPLGAPGRAVLYSLLIGACFTLVVLLESHRSYLQTGYTVRTLGRYFYPAMGFLVLGFALPALSLLEKWADRIALAAAIVVCLTDAVFFLARAVPYFAAGS